MDDETVNSFRAKWNIRIYRLFEVLADYVRSFSPARGIVRFLFDVSRWSFFPKNHIINIQTPSGKSAFIRARRTDLIQRYKQIVDSGRVPLIIDAGANIGFASLLFDDAFPHCRIIGLEPSQENLELAAMNVNTKSSILIKKCLWNKKTELYCENDDCAEPDAFRFGETVQPEKTPVSAISIDNLICEQADAELFIVKLDIEGAEREVLADAGEWRKLKPILMVEPHDHMIPGNQSLRGILQDQCYRDGDIILKKNVMMFFPATQS